MCNFQNKKTESIMEHIDFFQPNNNIKSKAYGAVTVTMT